MGRMKTIIKKVPGLVWASIILILLLSIFAKNFTASRNIENILKNSSILVVVSIGMTMTILSQQIDLSIGGVMSLSGTMAAFYIQPLGEDITGFNIIVALLIGVAVGLVVGIFNGLMIGVLKYNFWLVTFATMSIAYGITQGITGGYKVAGYSSLFRKTLSSGTEILGISNMVYISLIIIVIMALVLRYTRFGMHIYAVGDSEQCSRQSGINVKKLRFAVYTISGALAGLGGVLLIARVNYASAIVGSGYEWDAIAAVIIGGTSFEGGKGSIWGAAFGALIIAAVKSGLQLLGLGNYVQQTLIGLFILIVIIVDVLSTQRRSIQALRRVYKS